jgi:iron complex outermembrane receptor protein
MSRMIFNSVLLAGAALATTPGLGIAQQTDAPEAPGRGLEEVIVTAQRREQNLQDVALSVSALGSAQLERAGVTEMTDLVGKVPNLVASPGLTAGRATPIFAIRGLSQQEVTMLADPSVTIYFNDVPVPRSQGSNMSFFDIASVEVLKGPQGTLFGRNTTGGAILVRPQKPQDAFGASVSQMFGNYGAMETQAMINVPFGDWGALRIAGQHNESDGWLTDVITGKEVNSIDEDAGRISFDLHPSERWSSLFTASYSQSRSGGTGGYITALPAGVSAGLRALQTPLLAAQQQRGHFETASGVPMRNDVDVFSADNTTTIKLSENVSIKNIIGYRDIDYDTLEDTDGTSSLILTVNRIDKQHQISEELQIFGSHDWLTWIAGAFYFNEKGSNAGPSAGLGTGAGTPDPGLIEPNERMSDYYPNYINTNSGAENTSTAVFAQATFNLDKMLEGFSVTLGARQNWDKREVDIRNVGWLTPPAVNPAAFSCRFTLDTDGNPATPEVRPPLENCSLPLDADFSEPTYNISLAYRVTPDALVYLAHRHGYRTGGFGARATTQAGLSRTFEPETVDDVELGAKVDWQFGDAFLRTNLAVFHADYEDIQRLLTDPTLVPITTVTTNAGKAKIDGGEFEFVFRPVQMLEISGFYSYTDARFTEFIAPDGTDLSKAPFARAPKNIYGGTARIDLPLGNLGDASLSATYFHMDEFVTTDTFDPTAFVPGYDLWNFNLQLTGIGGSGADVIFFVDNAFDEEYVLPYQHIAQVNKVDTPGAPQTYGVRLRYRFGDH